METAFKSNGDFIVDSPDDVSTIDDVSVVNDLSENFAVGLVSSLLPNFFSSFLTKRPKHLLVAPGAYPRRKNLKGPTIGFALALPSNSKG